MKFDTYKQKIKNNLDNNKIRKCTILNNNQNFNKQFFGVKENTKDINILINARK